MVETPSWTHEFSRAFKDVRELYRYLAWEMPSELEAVAKTYPLFIPRSLADKIKAQGPNGSLAKEFLPHNLEIDLNLNESGYADPIGDRSHQVAPQLIHRYTSRVLFTPTSVCPVHCRYCFRKNELSPNDEIFQAEFEKTLSYLRKHSEISELIFTGGDPLTLSNLRLKSYLEAFAQIPTLKDIRFHTRYPVILPQRIDADLLDLLNDSASKFRTVSLAIHTNVIDEMDEDSDQAIIKLANLPIQLLSQTVLLKGINDRSQVLVALMNKLIQLKVRPYYLHHPDRVKGGMHFYLPLEEGRSLYSTLRDQLPGWALPQYVVDIPGGHGKVSAFNPESFEFSGQLLGRNGEFVSLSEVIH